MKRKVVFYQDPKSPDLPKEESLRVASEGCEYFFVLNEEEAKKIFYSGGSNAIFISNHPNEQLFDSFRDSNPKGSSILVTLKTMDEYAALLSYREDKLLDHLITGIGSKFWVVHDLRITIQKIVRSDIFGIEKYLEIGTPLIEDRIKSPKDRRLLNQKVSNYAEELRLGHHLAKLAYGISEELLMNATYDAPKSNLVHQSDAEKSCEAVLQCGCDGEIFAIAVRDFFGGLEASSFYNYIKKVLRRHEGEKIIDKKHSGAGLGFFKILFSSHALICNVEKGVCTEVVSVINIHSKIRDFSRMPRTLHFFQKSSN